MPRYAAEPPFNHGTPSKVAVLLINLGTPEAPTAPAVRGYLREFLSDPAVVELPRVLWLPVLHLYLLRTRPKKSAERYAQVWMSDGSPLKVHTTRQATLLRGYLGERTRFPLVVDYAMRYGHPSIVDKLGELKAQSCDRILLVPLYPQYSASATGSALAAAFAVLVRSRNMPAIRTVRHFHDHPGYIGALAQNVRDYWMKSGRPDKLVMSFHGVPRFTLDRGDPYHCQCQKTSRLLRDELGWPGERWLTTFQSRFGTDPWLQPYTDETVGRLAREGVKRLALVAPGFSADCLETLEELDRENREIFVHGGGEKFAYLPALNDSEEGVRVIEGVVRRELQGWA